MPGHDEKDVRTSREGGDRMPGEMEEGELGGTGRTGDIGSGGALGGEGAERTDPGYTGGQDRMTREPGVGQDDSDEELLENR